MWACVTESRKYSIYVVRDFPASTWNAATASEVFPPILWSTLLISPDINLEILLTFLIVLHWRISSDDIQVISVFVQVLLRNCQRQNKNLSFWPNFDCPFRHNSEHSPRSIFHLYGEHVQGLVTKFCFWSCKYAIFFLSI